VDILLIIDNIGKKTQLYQQFIGGAHDVSLGITYNLHFYPFCAVAQNG
jgi:hypothetical protein